MHTKYQIKQKLASLGDTFSIFDESGREVYSVSDKSHSFLQRFSIRDRVTNAEIAYIKQRLFSFGPKYKIYRNRRVVGTIQKSVASVKPKFVLKPTGRRKSKRVIFKGHVIDHDYEVYRNRKQIGKISKKKLRMSDTYNVDFSVGDSHVLFLSSAIAIDMVCHNPKSRYNRGKL